MQRTANENAAYKGRIFKRSDQPKIDNNKRQGWYYVKSLTGQRHDMVQTESQIATVDSCFDLVRSLQHGVASCEVFSWSTDIHKPIICRWWWPQMKLKSKSLPIGWCHCPRLQFGFQFGLYRVVAPLSFLRSISLASLFTSLSIFGWSDLLQILRRRAAFSFAVLCIIMFNC